MARGERPVGWKIGFTNETIWDEYGVHAPIWGPMYDSTAGRGGCRGHRDLRGRHAGPSRASSPRSRSASRRRPALRWTNRALLACVDAVAHGFEIVQSVFPRWRFKAADTVAAFALHGRYRHGPFVGIAPDERERWQAALSDFAIVLFRDGAEIDRGVARNVLGGGPLTALRPPRPRPRGLSPSDLALRAGDIVTTGTVTRAFPVKPGESWSTQLDGLAASGDDADDRVVQRGARGVSAPWCRRSVRRGAAPSRLRAGRMPRGGGR